MSNPVKGSAEPEVGKCGGPLRQAPGRFCTRPAGWGTDHVGVGHCKLHLGCTLTHRVAAREEMARRELAALGRPVEIDPETALLDLVKLTRGDVESMRELVALLDSTVGRDEWSLAGLNHLGDAVPHVLVRMYHEVVAAHADVASRAIKAGLQLRQAELAEEEGSLIRELLERLVSEVRAAPDDASALRIIGARMRELTPGNEGSAA